MASYRVIIVVPESQNLHICFSSFTILRRVLLCARFKIRDAEQSEKDAVHGRDEEVVSVYGNNSATNPPRTCEPVIEETQQYCTADTTRSTRHAGL